MKGDAWPKRHRHSPSPTRAGGCLPRHEAMRLSQRGPCHGNRRTRSSPHPLPHCLERDIQDQRTCQILKGALEGLVKWPPGMVHPDSTKSSSVDREQFGFILSTGPERHDLISLSHTEGPTGWRLVLRHTDASVRQAGLYDVPCRGAKGTPIYMLWL